MTDENIIETLAGICRLRSITTAPEVLKVLDQAEAVINWLIVESAENTTTALRVATLQERELSRLKQAPAEIMFLVSNHSGGHA